MLVSLLCSASYSYSPFLYGKAEGGLKIALLSCRPWMQVDLQTYTLKLKSPLSVDSGAHLNTLESVRESSYTRTQESKMVLSGAAIDKRNKAPKYTKIPIF